MIKANFKLITLNYFEFEGYGRLKNLLKKHIDFNPVAKDEMVLAYPHPRDNPNGKTIFHTVFEADKIPDKWVEPANQADALIVPAPWVKEIFENSGVIAPIHVIPEGTDEWERFPTPYGDFTFLHFDATSENYRKGTDLVIRAFLDLFANKQGVRLILKGHAREHPEEKRYPNIQYVYRTLPRIELNMLMEKAHCFIFPSRGEGFGLPPLEMMAHAVPTIVSDNSAMSAYAKYAIPIKTEKLIPSQYDIWECDGHWFEPSIDDLKEKMLMVYHNYEREKKRAIANRKKLMKIYDFRIVANQIVNTVHKIING
jgi:hypothetical protein